MESREMYRGRVLFEGAELLDRKGLPAAAGSRTWGDLTKVERERWIAIAGLGCAHRDNEINFAGVNAALTTAMNAAPPGTPQFQFAHYISLLLGGLGDAEAREAAWPATP